MRTKLTLVLSLLMACASAQNWALINPAYKYNYSDDGTDTISNQILVTHIDTLGVGSFRYELNRIAKLCNTCGDSCDMHINIPQFLQGECHMDASSWRFTAPGDLMIHPQAILNDQWVFDIQNGTIGTLSELTEETVFGTMDSVRTMATILGDTVRWSKNSGILHWHLHDEPTYHLIGVHGPQIGELVPSLQQFFRYQPGDVVQFLYTSCSNMHCGHRYERFEIQQRTEQPGHLEFSGPLYQRNVGYYGEVWYTNWPMYTWVLDSTTQVNLRPLSSWPGQAMILDSMGSWFINEDLLLLAKHYQDSTGAYIVTGESSSGRTLLDVLDTTSGDCLNLTPPYNTGNDYRLDTQLGLRSFSRSAGYNVNSFATLGAIIDGDTIGTVYNEAYFGMVGIEELGATIDPLYPDPTNEQITVPNAEPGSIYSVSDAQGRVVAVNTFTAAAIIDVRQLQPGSYVLLRQEHPPQRFMVVR